jgi:hypothetical protein
MKNHIIDEGKDTLEYIRGIDDCAFMIGASVFATAVVFYGMYRIATTDERVVDANDSES